MAITRSRALDSVQHQRWLGLFHGRASSHLVLILPRIHPPKCFQDRWQSWVALCASSWSCCSCLVGRLGSSEECPSCQAPQCSCCAHDEEFSLSPACASTPPAHCLHQFATPPCYHDAAHSHLGSPRFYLLRKIVPTIYLPLVCGSDHNQPFFVSDSALVLLCWSSG